MEAIANFFVSTGFYQFFQGDNWKSAIMLVIAVVLLFLGIVKKFEPLLLVPIAFGMLVTNLPGAEMFHEILFAGGHVHWDLFGGEPITAQFLSEMLANGVSADMLQPYADSLMTAAQSTFDPGVLDNLMAQLAASGSEAVGTLSNQLDALVTAEQYLASYGITLSNVTVSVGLIDVLYLGIKLGIYPCLIFMGVGAMTDFGPLIANPKSLRPAGHFPHLRWLPPAGLHRRGGLLRGYHRRRGRPHGYLRHRPVGPGPAGPHRCVRLFLHGAGARHPTTHYEGADHQGGAPDRHEAPA